MAYFQTKSSRVAIVTEVTEGTPVSPSAAGSYIPIESDFSMAPSFDTLTNDELTGSIGSSKDVLGLENPESSFSLYLKSSGSEGVAPQADVLFNSAFGGKSVESTEYNTTASSTAGDSTTRAVIKSTGNMNNKERGEALLIKDSALSFGYEIVNVYTVDDANTVSTLFNIPGAPASGVGLGKASLYKPADTGHPTFSLWGYKANSAAVEMISGCRVSELSIDVPAGDFVNCSYTIPGLAYYFNPIEITATTDTIDFTDDGGAVSASLTNKFYKDPIDAADALAAAMTAASAPSGGQTISVSYSSSTGKFTVSATGTTFDVDWATTTNTLGAKFGFTADDSGSTSYVSDAALTLTSPQTPSFYSVNPFVAKNNKVQFGSFYDYTCFSAQNVSFTLSNEITAVSSICSESGKEASVITARECSVDVLANLQQYESHNFKKYRAGDNVQFAFSFGEKSGGNWIPGKCGNLALFTSTITSFELVDTDGLVTLQTTLTGYVESGLGEIYLNFL